MFSLLSTHAKASGTACLCESTGSPTAVNISIMNIVRLAVVVFLFPLLLAVILWSRLNVLTHPFFILSLSNLLLFNGSVFLWLDIRKKLSQSCSEKPQPVVETSKVRATLLGCMIILKKVNDTFILKQCKCFERV